MHVSPESPVILIDTDRITDWVTFHAVFMEACGFPEFYGANMNAWIDCMTYLDDPAAGMTSVHCGQGRVVTLLLSESTRFASRCREQYEALIECTAFVNWRRLETGQPAVLALAFHR